MGRNISQIQRPEHALKTGTLDRRFGNAFLGQPVPATGQKKPQKQGQSIDFAPPTCQLPLHS
jgi:hypothetical protein